MVVTFAFVAARLAIQGRVIRKFGWDDAYVVISWLLLLTTTSIYSREHDAAYLIAGILTGQIDPPPPDLPQIMIRQNHIQWATAQLFHTGLWFIKFSFLALFARLGQKVRGQKILWWCALAVTLPSWVIVIAISGWQCFLTSSMAKLEGMSCTFPCW